MTTDSERKTAIAQAWEEEASLLNAWSGSFSGLSDMKKAEAEAYRAFSEARVRRLALEAKANEREV